jgi:hypothetical protein
MQQYSRVCPKCRGNFRVYSIYVTDEPEEEEWRELGRAWLSERLTSWLVDGVAISIMCTPVRWQRQRTLSVN